MTMTTTDTPMSNPERHRAALMGCELINPTENSGGPLKHYGEVLSTRLAQHDGTIRLAAGSLTVAEFEDAANAVNCAISIQDQIAQYNNLHLDEGSITAKIGIHFGEIFQAGEEIKGGGIEVLEEILPSVPAGKIYLTREGYVRVRIHLHLKLKAVRSEVPGLPASAKELFSVDWEAVAGNLAASLKRLDEDDLQSSLRLTSRLGIVPSKRASPIVMIFILLFIFILFKLLKWL